MCLAVLPLQLVGLWSPRDCGALLTDIGMYNVPSFTLARAIGGVSGWYWVNVMKRSNTPLIILASVCPDPETMTGPETNTL